MGKVFAVAKSYAKYCDANAFYKEHGNLKIPQDYVGASGCRLVDWIVRQRRSRRLGELSGEKIRLLDEVGFVWNALQSDAAEQESDGLVKLQQEVS